MNEDVPLSRRQYLTIKMYEEGTSIWLAAEAVASTAIEHPEWDMTETHTYAEWESGRRSFDDPVDAGPRAEELPRRSTNGR